MHESERREVVILGGGAMGTAAALALARRGIDALLLERWTIGHRLGSSHGGTRVFRLAYFEHADYVPLLREAVEGFRRVEQESGERLLESCGVLIVGEDDSTLISASAESARQHGIPVERLSAGEVAERFPQFAGAGGGPAQGLLEPGAGFVRPELAVRSMARLARARGAEVRERIEVRGWRPRRDGIEVETRDGRILAERLVLTAGAWNPGVPDPAGLDQAARDPAVTHGNSAAHDAASRRGLLSPIDGEPFPIPLVPTRQVQAWLRVEDPALASPARLPAWLLDRRGRPALYGIPIDPRAGEVDLGRGLAKIAVHGDGRAVDPDRFDRAASAEEVASLEALAREHLPGLRGRVASAGTCLYTNSPDGHFVIDLHPADPRVAVAAGFSGHGFKFAPVVGEVLADLAMTRRATPSVSAARPIGFLSLRARA